jgi:hypothetical protein
MPSYAWHMPPTLLFHQGTLEVIHPCRWFGPIVPGMMICQQGCHLAPCGTHPSGTHACTTRGGQQTPLVTFICIPMNVPEVWWPPLPALVPVRGSSALDPHRTRTEPARERRHAARLDGCDAREDNRHAQKASSAPLRTSPSCGVRGYTRWSLPVHPPYCLWPVLLSVGQERTLPPLTMRQRRVSSPHMAQHLRRLRTRPPAPSHQWSSDISGPFIRIRQCSCIRIWLQARERSPEL